VKKKLLGGLSAAVLTVGLVAASPLAGDAGVTASASATSGSSPQHKPHHKPAFSMRQIGRAHV